MQPKATRNNIDSELVFGGKDPPGIFATIEDTIPPEKTNKPTAKNINFM